MQHITPSSLSGLPSRISYLSQFLELSPADGEALLAAKPLIAPLIPTVLDLVYSKLLSFDVTAKAFVPRNRGYEGELVKGVEELSLEHPQIAMRKDFLKVCLEFLLILLSPFPLLSSLRFMGLRILHLRRVLLIFWTELPSQACLDDGSYTLESVLGISQQRGHNAHRQAGLQASGE